MIERKRVIEGKRLYWQRSVRKWTRKDDNSFIRDVEDSSFNVVSVNHWLEIAPQQEKKHIAATV